MFSNSLPDCICGSWHIFMLLPIHNECFASVEIIPEKFQALCREVGYYAQLIYTRSPIPFLCLAGGILLAPTCEASREGAT